MWGMRWRCSWRGEGTVTCLERGFVAIKGMILRLVLIDNEIDKMMIERVLDR